MKKTVLAIALILPLAACTTQERNTAAGASIGAGVGGLATNSVGGAVAGGLIGGGVGAATANR